MLFTVSGFSWPVTKLAHLSVLSRMCNQRSHTSSNESPSDYYKRTITIPFLDHLLTQLNDRFPDNKWLPVQELQQVQTGCSGYKEYKMYKG